MKILLLNQTFHPDVASSAQHLSDLARALAAQGHRVTVLTGRRAYDAPEKSFPAQESWHGIRILRLPSTGFGKAARWSRFLDIATFLAASAARLAFLPRHDVVVALSSPPLIPVLGACLASLRRSRFVYWVMDLNPDEAIAAGWLQHASPVARLLERCSRFSLRRADKVVALDRFMQQRILAKGVSPERLAVIPPWSHDDSVHFDPVGRERFRKQHGLDGKFVIMHSGNHSPCHPLDSVLDAAHRLESDPAFAFCFVGGGSEWRRLRRLPLPSNLTFLPYQPIDTLSASLSAADVHLVLLGAPFVGLVHPCKIYNILQVAAPILYLGPKTSHLSEILEAARSDALPTAWAPHGDGPQVVRQIQALRCSAPKTSERRPARVAARFSRHTLLPRFLAEIPC